MDKPKGKKGGKLSSSEIAAALGDDSSPEPPPGPPPATRSTSTATATPGLSTSTHTAGPGSLDMFDSTMPPLSDSMMEELDRVTAEKDLDDRIFSEDIEKDIDPDYALPDLEEGSEEEDGDLYDTASKPPPTTPKRVAPGTPGTPGTSTGTPGTSTSGFTTPFRMPAVPPVTPTPGQGKKRTRTESEPASTSTPIPQKNLFPAELKLLPGARTPNPIYAFFLVNDLMKIHPVSGIETIEQKRVICQIKVGGAICGRYLKQSDTTSSSLLSHLKSKHPKQLALYEAEGARLKAEKEGSFSRIKHLYQAIGGIPETQEDADAAAAEAGEITF